MICPQCGTQNEEGSAHCTNCGAKLTPGAEGAPLQAIPPAYPAPGTPYQPLPGAGYPPQAGYPQGAPQGYPPNPYGGAPPQIPTYMTQSILVTLFCCIPLGIVSIVKASKVSRLLATGDYAGAAQASKENKTLLWIGVGVGAVVVVLSIIVNVAKIGQGMH